MLLNFKWFRGSTPLGGVADWWMGVGVGMGVWEGVPWTHACTRMHTHARTCMLNMLNMDVSMLVAISNSIHVCVCMCVHVRVCACMWGHPPCPQIPPDTPPPTCPLPRAAGSPKHQISITLELIEIIRFCLKILYLTTFWNSYRL